jgi:hypothetical protein
MTGGELTVRSIDENEYYVGIDFGYHTVSVCYLNHKSYKPTLLDLTGGYGNIYSPACMCYIHDESKWLIGGEALHGLDDGHTQFVEGLLDGLNKGAVIEVGSVAYSYEALIAHYIEVLLAHFKQLNPKGVIKALSVTLPDRCYGQSGVNLEMTLNKILESTVEATIKVISNTEGIIDYLKSMDLLEKDHCLMIDFGHKALRIYHIQNSNPISVTPYREVEALSGESIRFTIGRLIEQCYCKHYQLNEIDEKGRPIIEKMMTTYLPYFFKKFKEKKGLKLTFSTVFPPFQMTLSEETLFQGIEPYRVIFEEILVDLKRAYPNAEIILTGNGFHMGWPLDHLKQMSFALMVEDVDGIVKGTAINSFSGNNSPLVMYTGILTKDYGVMIQTSSDDEFLCLKAKGIHYKEQSEAIGLVINRASTIVLTIVSRSETGIIEEIGEWGLTPLTEDKIYRILLNLEFQDETSLLPVIQYDLL